MFEDQHVLVTGGAGFIGSYLVESLADAGACVTVFDNLQAGMWENVRRAEGGDLRPETGGLKPETGNLKPETGNLKPETGDRRPEGGDRKRETGTLKPETGDLKPEGGNRRAEGGNRKPGTGGLKPETGDRRPEGGDRRPETGSLRFPTRTPVRCVEGDVREAKCVGSVLKDTQPEYVFHLAANASVPGSVNDPVYDFHTNCAGTFNVLDAVRVFAPSARVILVSSGAVYGEPTEFPIVETMPVRPISPYGASKACAETECRIFREVYGLDVVIARLFNTYGPRMPRFVVLDFLKKLRANPDTLEILGSGQQVRDFNYVSDTVQGLITLAQSGVTGEGYNVASGRSHSIRSLADTLLGILGLAGRTEIVCTGESWPGDAQRWEVEISKLKGLGYEPRVSLEEGLRRVVKWFEKKGY